MPDFLWGQLALQFAISVFMVIFLVANKPMESRFALIMEVFNECTCVVLMYHLQCFSDFVPDPATRNLVGFSFIVVTMFNIGVHVYFLARAAYQAWKLKAAKSKYQKAMKDREQQMKRSRNYTVNTTPKKLAPIQEDIDDEEDSSETPPSEKKKAASKVVVESLPSRSPRPVKSKRTRQPKP